MEQIKTTVKKWGNSFGIVLPKDTVKNNEIKEGSKIEIIIKTRDKTKVKDLFGIMKGKFKKPVEQMMREIDEELWGIKR